MLASAVSAYVRRYAVLPGRAPWCSPTTTARTTPRWLSERGHRGPVVDARSDATGELPERARRATASRCSTMRSPTRAAASASRRRRAWPRRAGVAVTVRPARSPAISSPSRAAGARSCICTASPAARPRSTTRARASSREVGAGRALGGRVHGSYSATSARRTAGRPDCRGAAAGFEAAGTAVPTVAPTRRREEPLLRCGWCRCARHEPRAEAVRRPAERRRGLRHRARGARGLPVDRAREALHRDGLRHRPGQARQHQRHGDPRAGARQDRFRRRARRRSAPTTRR